MPRTWGRPIPSGRIRPKQALVFSFLLMCTGSAILLACSGIEAFLLGFFAAVWYNGVYLYLKKISAFSVIPGALTGAAPPAIGWISGGGIFFSPALGALCLCFFIWQVAHSWLLYLEYGGEYEKAGLPSLTRIWSRRQIIRTTFVWTLCTAVICLIVSLYVAVIAPVVRIALLVSALCLAGSGVMFLNEERSRNARGFLFGKLNAYLFIIMALLVCGRLFDFR
jgi:protoheme IX farnesyltransferase